MMNTPRFTPFPVLLTERFRLRELRMSDDNEIFILRTDEDVNRFLDRRRASSMEDAHGFIQKISDGVAKDQSIMWAIEPWPGGALVGTICLYNLSLADAMAEIGYELLPQFQGKGVMQEVLPSVIKYGFSRLKLGVIKAEMMEENVKSARLLERHGFVKKGIEDGMVIYTCYRSEIQ